MICTVPEKGDKFQANVHQKTDGSMNMDPAPIDEPKTKKETQAKATALRLKLPKLQVGFKIKCGSKVR